MIKWAAAIVNRDLLDLEKAKAGVLKNINNNQLVTVEEISNALDDLRQLT